MKEFISKKILVYNPETGKHEPIDAIRGESAYEVAVRTGQTALPEDEWIKQVQNGQIDGDFVKTVNSLHPDENGNVEIEVGNPDVITTLTRDEFNALTTAQIQKMYEDGVRTILVENEMEEGEGTYTISWDGITDKPNVYPPTEHRHEYAENLLKNAEFKIATMGYNKSYNGTIYNANEWIGNRHGSLSISNGVKTLVAENGFTWMKQELWSDGRDIGKTYTLAVALPDGTHLVGSGTAPSAASNDEEVFIDLTAPDSRCWVMAMKVGNVMQVRIDASQIGASFSFLNVALYEGTYTAQTLPPFIPVDPRIEMLKLGLPVQPENLLDNSDWRVTERIINQRGKTAYSGIRKYTIDRWYIYKNSTTDAILTVEYNGISVDGFLYQLLDINKIKENTVYTLAIKTTDEAFVIYSSTFENSTGSTTFYFNGNYAVVRIAGGSYLWAALYEGEYTAESLPPYVPRPYAVELAECLRYHLEYDTSFEATGRIDSTGDTAYFYVYTPTKMRKTPSFAPEANATGTIITPVDSLKINMADVSVLRCSGNLCVLKYTFSPAQTALAWQNCALTSYYRAALNADI